MEVKLLRRPVAQATSLKGSSDGWRTAGSGRSVRAPPGARPLSSPLLNSLVPLPPPAARWLRLLVFLSAC